MKEGGLYCPLNINTGISEGENSPSSTHPLSRPPAYTRLHPNLTLSASKMFTHGNNFSGSSFDRPTAEDNNSGFNDYLFGTPSGDSQSSTFTGQTHGFDLEAAVAGPSTTVADNWWLGPSLDGDSIRYSGSTVLDGAWNGFTSPYTSQTRFVPGNDALERSEFYHHP